MSQEVDDRTGAPDQEPFILSMLPFAGLALLLLIALWVRWSPEDSPAPSTAPPADPTETVIARWEQAPVENVETTPEDFSQGPEDAPITIVEFSDFECPYCRTGAQAAKDALERHPGSVRIVFKNLPLDTACNENLSRQLHPLACRAALLARCAGERDPAGFWRAHDALFRASALSEDVLSQIAESFDTSGDELDRCMASEAQLARLKSDIAAARRLGVSGTPTFFLNGRRVADYRDGILGRLVEHVLAGGS